MKSICYKTGEFPNVQFYDEYSIYIAISTCYLLMGKVDLRALYEVENPFFHHAPSLKRIAAIFMVQIWQLVLGKEQKIHFLDITQHPPFLSLYEIREPKFFDNKNPDLFGQKVWQLPFHVC